ncbi:MAG: UbiA family prenyltransferase [Candidatus Planktophila sp.]
MKTQVIGLAKASHFGPTLIVTTLSYLFAELYWPTGPSLLIALAFFSGQLIVGWSNDLFDYADDLSHKRMKKPLVAGLITDRLLKSWLGAMIPISIVLNLFGPLGFVGGGLSLFAIAWALAYNFYFKFNIFSPLPYAVAFAILPSCIALSKEKTPPLWMILGGAFLGIAAHFINVLKDMDQDHASGIKGLPQRCGKKGSIALAITFIAIAIAQLLIAIPLQLES